MNELWAIYDFFEIWPNFRTMNLMGKRYKNKFENFRPITYSENGWWVSEFLQNNQIEKMSFHLQKYKKYFKSKNEIKS